MHSIISSFSLLSSRFVRRFLTSFFFRFDIIVFLQSRFQFYSLCTWPTTQNYGNHKRQIEFVRNELRWEKNLHWKCRLCYCLKVQKPENKPAKHCQWCWMSIYILMPSFTSFHLLNCCFDDSYVFALDNISWHFPVSVFSSPPNSINFAHATWGQSSAIEKEHDKIRRFQE